MRRFELDISRVTSEEAILLIGSGDSSENKPERIRVFHLDKG